MSMQLTSVRYRTRSSAEEARASSETEPALTVATVYQDPLTRHWATELWDRVGRLVGQGDICHQSWRIGDLTAAQVFTSAVKAAAKADVLVISVRDAGELPVNLYVWIDAWMPRRAMRPGAMVALIGVPPQPDTHSGRTHKYLEAVTRRVGLDFLPRERMLPAQSSAVPGLVGMIPAHNLTMRWSGGSPIRVADRHLQRRLTE